MKRQQLVLIVAATTFVIVLFSLPKVLLNKEEKELENSAQLDKSESKPKTSSTTQHSSVSFSESDIDKIKGWKLALSKAVEY